MAELRAAWEGIRYARLFLFADHIILERDSATVIAWIRRAVATRPSFPLLHDAAAMLKGTMSLTDRHVYREANATADWMAAYVAFHGVYIL